MAQSFEITKPTHSHSSDQVPTRPQLLILLKQFHQEEISEIWGLFFSNHHSGLSWTTGIFNQIEGRWCNYILSCPVHCAYSFCNFCFNLVSSTWSNTYHLSMVKGLLCSILRDLLIYWNSLVLSHQSQTPG